MKDASPVKDKLVGRVVGFSVPHLLDPSQVEEGEPLVTEATRWGRVTGIILGEGLYAVDPLHGMPPGVFGNYWNMPASAFHTVMPEATHG